MKRKNIIKKEKFLDIKITENRILNYLIINKDKVKITKKDLALGINFCTKNQYYKHDRSYIPILCAIKNICKKLEFQGWIKDKGKYGVKLKENWKDKAIDCILPLVLKPKKDLKQIDYQKALNFIDKIANSNSVKKYFDYNFLDILAFCIIGTNWEYWEPYKLMSTYFSMFGSVISKEYNHLIEKELGESLKGISNDRKSSEKMSNMILKGIKDYLKKNKSMEKKNE